MWKPVRLGHPCPSGLSDALSDEESRGTVERRRLL